MLFRPKPYLWDIDDVTLEEVLHLADEIAHNEITVRPIYECVKVYARITESCEMTYARHRFDLGTRVVSAEEIAQRIKDDERSAVVFNALKEVEDIAKSSWPFQPGSSSWCLLEILHPEIKIAGPVNKPAIIFRNSCRINHKGKLSKSKLLERLFLSFRNDLESAKRDGYFTVAFDPSVTLKNTSGTGAFATLREAFLEEPLGFSQALQSFATDIVTENFEIDPTYFPGINVSIGEYNFRLVGEAFIKNKKALISEAKSTKKTNDNYPPPLPGVF